MDFTQKDIEDYLQQKLNSEQTAAFKKRLEKDGKFADEVKLHQLVLDAIEIRGEKKLSRFIEEVDEQLEDEGFFDDASSNSAQPPSAIGRKMWSGKILSIAAAVLVMITVSLFFFFQKSAEEKLVAEFYEPFEDVIMERLSVAIKEQGMAQTDVDLPTLQNGMNFYNSDNYPQAISEFENYLQESPESEFLLETQLYLAIAYLETDKTIEAAEVLMKLAQQSNFELQTKAQWYLLLSFLKMNQTDQALPLLDALEENLEYREKIARIRTTLGE